MLYSEWNYNNHRLRIYHVTSGIVNFKLKYRYKLVIYFDLILIKTLSEQTRLREKNSNDRLTYRQKNNYLLQLSIIITFAVVDNKSTALIDTRLT